MINSFDPSFRQIVFKDFDESSTASSRFTFIEDLMKTHSIRYNFIDHFYTGPSNNRKISRKSYVEFSSADAAKHAMLALGGKNTKFQVSESKTCTLTFAISAVARKRNYNLRQAHEMIKSADQVKNKNVQIKWKDRVIKVDSQVVFQQDKSELTGTFLASFESLHLP